ncbi:hypothetical protein BDY19DRAFT_998598 [Irpex rosettiformis]|uniref:Uncharacterized protein n=1 Tax=Irpex rosettiformis TaxID=378272 RepID=A0ACB8TN88_9APHY|nr:hypothetical protein BDY19DRAFT_998598 [Irpex rosettiformis]
MRNYLPGFHVPRLNKTSDIPYIQHPPNMPPTNQDPYIGREECHSPHSSPPPINWDAIPAMPPPSVTPPLPSVLPTPPSSPPRATSVLAYADCADLEREIFGSESDEPSLASRPSSAASTGTLGTMDIEDVFGTPSDGTSSPLSPRSRADMDDFFGNIQGDNDSGNATVDDNSIHSDTDTESDQNTAVHYLGEDEIVPSPPPEGDPQFYLPRNPHYPPIIPHPRNLLPPFSIDRGFEPLSVRDSFIPKPLGTRNHPGNFTRSRTVPLPHHSHLLIRRQHMLIFEHLFIIAYSHSFNRYIVQLRLRAEANPALLQNHPEQYYVGPENIGNPFLFTIERLRLHQLLAYYEEYNRTVDDNALVSLCELADEVLSFRIHSSDSAVIIQQRLAGYYGPTYSMPHHPDEVAHQQAIQVQ